MGVAGSVRGQQASALGGVLRSYIDQLGSPVLVSVPAQHRARQIDGDLWTTAKFIDGVRLPYIAPRWG